MMASPDVVKARKKAALAVAVVAVFVVACLAVVEAVGMLAQSKGIVEGREVAVSGTVEITEVEVPDEPFYVLLIGSDSRKGTALYTGRANEHSQVDQRSDIMTLMRVDPYTPTITLVTVPRDTKLEGASEKINEALAADNDPQAVVSVVEQLTGVEIDYYAMTTFIGFEDFVDALGGVTVDVPQTVTVPDPSTAKDVQVTAGDDKQLNGSQALVVARARKEYGDNQEALRQINVRNIEESIIYKALDACFASGSSGGAFPRMLDALFGNVTTNLDYNLVREVAYQIAENIDSLTFYSCTGPYEGENDENDLWTVEEDKEAWAELMAAVDAGEDPTGIVPIPEFPDS